MYCSKCGLELPDDAKFCTFCGEPFDHLTSRQTQPSQPTPTPTPTPYQGTPVATTRSTGGIISALCTVFIVGILLIFFGTQMIYIIPSTGITLLVIGAIVILCIGCSICGSGRRRRGYGGWGWVCCCSNCGGSGGSGGSNDCDCCDCGDCGDCDC